MRTMCVIVGVTMMACSGSDGGSKSGPVLADATGQADAAEQADAVRSDASTGSADAGVLPDALSSPDAAVGVSCGSLSCEGGIPIGQWSLGAICFIVGPDNQDCGQVTRSYEFDASGALTVNVDNSFTRNLAVLSVTLTENYPASCVPDDIACADFHPDETTECTGENSNGCTCLTTTTQATAINQSGTWLVQGTTMILSIEGETPTKENAEYCATENELFFFSQPSDLVGIGYTWVRSE